MTQPYSGRSTVPLTGIRATLTVRQKIHSPFVHKLGQDRPSLLFHLSRGSAVLERKVGLQNKKGNVGTVSDRQRQPRKHSLWALGTLTALVGCEGHGSSQGPFQKRQGCWVVGRRVFWGQLLPETSGVGGLLFQSEDLWRSALRGRCPFSRDLRRTSFASRVWTL